MHSIRRSVVRAVTSTSLLKPLSINSSSQFLIRSNRPAASIQSLNFKRWASDEARNEARNEEDLESEEFIESSDAQEQNTVSAAVSHATETVRDAAASAAASAFGTAAGESGSSGEVTRDRDGRVSTPNPTIYVGNISFEVTPEELKQEFEAVAPVKSVKLATDGRGLSKGFGYIEFETVEDAAAAIAAKDQTTFEGRRMIVNYMSSGSRDRGLKNEPSKTLFIGNLAFEMSDADLNKLFRDIRNVIDVRVAIDRRTGQPRGFAHADFVDTESAVAAMDLLQGKEVYGRELRVDYSGQAKDRADFAPHGERRGGYGGDRGGDRGGYGGGRGGYGGGRGGYGGDRGGDRGGYGGGRGGYGGGRGGYGGDRGGDRGGYGGGRGGYGGGRGGYGGDRGGDRGGYGDRSGGGDF